MAQYTIWKAMGKRYLIPIHNNTMKNCKNISENAKPNKDTGRKNQK